MKINLRILFWITIINYIVQIPYNLHLYHTLASSLSGFILLAATFLLFIIPYIFLKGGMKSGYVGLIIFLSIEFLFYFSNILFSMANGYPPFFQLENHDPILFTAFLIGYVNLFASGYFLYYFLKHSPNE
jgi:hypothetical protein